MTVMALTAALWCPLLLPATAHKWGIPMIPKRSSHNKRKSLQPRASSILSLQKARGGSVEEATNAIVETENNNKKSNSKEPKNDPKQQDARKGPFVFSIYQPGDGSDNDPDKIPERYLSMHKGNREAAKASLKNTIEWRTQHDVDTILQRPNPIFDICKTITPHSFLGRDATGHIVFFQRPAVDSGEHLNYAKKNNMSNDGTFV